MHTNPIADPETVDGTHDAVILDLLLIEHDGLWSIDELERMVGDVPPWRTRSPGCTRSA